MINEENEKQQEPTLEELFEQIDGILEKMENENPGLDELFALYEEGLKKLQLCRGKLDMIEKKMLILNSDKEAEEFE